MCNIKEVPSTPEEDERIKSGYKVFYNPWGDDKKLRAPFSGYTLTKDDDWLIARDPTEGFHVFTTVSGAAKYRKALAKGFYPEEKLFVKKVLIKEIIAIGQTSPTCWGGDVCDPHSVMRCKQIKLATSVHKEPTTEGQ